MKTNIPVFLHFNDRKKELSKEHQLTAMSKTLQTSKMEITRSYKETSNFKRNDQK